MYFTFSMYSISFFPFNALKIGKISSSLPKEGNSPLINYLYFHIEILIFFSENLLELCVLNYSLINKLQDL